MPATQSRSNGSLSANFIQQLAEFAAAMANKLAAARSMPDLTTVYQAWFGQRMQRCVEDSNHVIADVQKLIRTGSRLAQNGNGRS